MRTETTPRQEEAARLRRALGWSLKRIARRLQITESAVSRLLARADLERNVSRRRALPKRPGPPRRTQRIHVLRTNGFY